MEILAVICIFAPFPLWLVETFVAYPHLIEELFKYVVVKKIPNERWTSPIILGLIFAFSESVLYLINYIQLGNFINLPLRLILTSALHSWLFLLQFLFRKSISGSIGALLLAMVIHYLYNLYIPAVFG